MQNLYSKAFDLRTSDYDRYNRLLPASILDLFQVVAGEHADVLGCGVNSLMEKGLLWMLVRTKYQVVKWPALWQHVIVKTWPLPESRAGFQREYLVESEDGELLIKGTSDWVVIHAEKRRIMPTNGVYPENFEYIKDKNFEERAARVPDFEIADDGIEVCPRYSQLDMNGHVNNTKYANYAIDALNPDQNTPLNTFQIDYRHEVYQGEKITVYANSTDGTTLIKGLSDDGSLKFACSFGK